MTETSETRAVDLAIGGMTCASCAARVEKKLNKLTGVRASVNCATERAHVEAPPGVSVAELVSTVEQTGYTAAPASNEFDADESRPLRTRLLASAALSVPVLVLSGMTEALSAERRALATAVLTKPIDMSVLLDAIDEAVAA